MQIIQAVETVLKQGIYTKDLAKLSALWVSTNNMGDAVKNCLYKL